MSSYLSQPYQANAPFVNTNLDLIGKVIQLKQGKYDVAKSQLQQAYDAFGQTQVIQDYANKYIGAKLTDKVAQANQLGGLDLSKSKNVDRLKSLVSNAASDPIILEAIDATNRKQQYTQQAELAKKDKGYSDINYKDGLKSANYEEYVNDTTGTVKLGNLNYQAYTDTTNESLELIKKVKDLKGKRRYEESDGNGGMNVRNIEGMTETEISKLLISSMPPQVRSQLAINGRARYDWNKDDIKKDFDIYKSARITQLEADKKSYEGIPDNEAQVKDTQITIDRLKSTDMSTNEMASILENKRFVNSTAKMAGREWDVSYEEDKVWTEKQKLDADRRKEKAKKGVDENGNLIVETSTSARQTELSETAEGTKGLQDSQNQNYNVIKLEATKLLTTLRGEEKTAFESALSLVGLNKDLTWREGTGQDFTKNSKADAIIKAFNKAGLKFNHKNSYNTLTKANIDRTSQVKDIIETDKVGIEQAYNEDPDGYINSLKNTYAITSKAKESSSLNITNYGGQLPRISGVTGLFDSQLTGGKEAIELNKKIGDFATKAGGLDNIKKYLKDNPDEIRTFAKLTEESDKVYKGLYKNARFDKNLMQDSKSKIEKEIQRRSSEKTLSTFTIYNDINISTPKVMETIISQLSANKKLDYKDEVDAAVIATYGQGGENFDPKLPGTFSRMGKNIVMTQNQGAIGYKDEKDGSTSKSKGIKNAVYVLEPNETAYKTALKYIQLEEDKLKGFDANTTTATMPTSRVEFSELKKSKQNDATYVENMASNMKGLNLKNPQGNSVFGITDPSIYITKQGITDLLTNEKNGTAATNLNAKFGQQKVEQFSASLLSRLEGFQAKPVIKETFIDGEYRKYWGVEIKNDKGATFLTKSLGVVNLNSDVKYAIDTFPQTFIMHYIMQELQNSQDKNVLNTILDNGIKTTINE